MLLILLLASIAIVAFSVNLLLVSASRVSSATNCESSGYSRAQAHLAIRIGIKANAGLCLSALLVAVRYSFHCYAINHLACWNGLFFIVHAMRRCSLALGLPFTGISDSLCRLWFWFRQKGTVPAPNRWNHLLPSIWCCALRQTASSLPYRAVTAVSLCAYVWPFSLEARNR